MKNETLQIQGMSCGHCVKAVTAALGALPGVVVKRVEVGSAEVEYDEQQTSREGLMAALQEEGYSVPRT